MHIVGGFLKGIIALGMIAAVIVFGVWVWKATEAVNPIKQNTCTGSQTFTVKPNQTVQEVSDALAAVGIIDNSFFFRARLKLLNAETKLQAGTFVLDCNQDYDTVIRRLTTPNDIAAVHFTVIEGWRLEQIAENLGSSAIVSPTHFLDATTTYTGALSYINGSDVLASADIPHDHGLEGFLFPDTYDAKQDTSGDSTDAVIQVMLAGFEDRLSSLSDAGVTGVMSDVAKLKVDNKPATLYQVITLASIVQREAAVESEMPDIAQIYWNRMIQASWDRACQCIWTRTPRSSMHSGSPARGGHKSRTPALRVHTIRITTSYCHRGQLRTRASLQSEPHCTRRATITCTLLPSATAVASTILQRRWKSSPSTRLSARADSVPRPVKSWIKGAKAKLRPEACPVTLKTRSPTVRRSYLFRGGRLVSLVATCVAAWKAPALTGRADAAQV